MKLGCAAMWACSELAGRGGPYARHEGGVALADEVVEAVLGLVLLQALREVAVLLRGINRRGGVSDPCQADAPSWERATATYAPCPWRGESCGRTNGARETC